MIQPPIPLSSFTDDSDSTWVCEYCDAQLETELLAEKHEEICHLRSHKSSDRKIKNQSKEPSNNFLFIGPFLLFLTFFLTWLPEGEIGIMDDLNLGEIIVPMPSFSGWDLLDGDLKMSILTILTITPVIACFFKNAQLAPIAVTSFVGIIILDIVMMISINDVSSLYTEKHLTGYDYSDNQYGDPQYEFRPSSDLSIGFGLLLNFLIAISLGMLAFDYNSKVNLKSQSVNRKSPISEIDGLNKLKELLDSEMITLSEFEELKKRLLR